ncbi:glycosyltransferase [Bizionia sediminis]|uniref:Glycosyltransferase n=1 Tax=Bizionia sediminis TaxID=1737064 RepID=A0ABW5KS54_9FLAO
MKSLTIISHTEHYLTADGMVVGLSATVTEINSLLAVFDSIIHVAMLHHTPPPIGAIPYISNRVTFVALPAVGGPKFRDKLTILKQLPKILALVNNSVRQTDCFQFRAPTGIGVFVIPYLIWGSSKKGWFKYAGNWKQTQAPWSYRFQKWLLKQQSRRVTMNGYWQNEPKHCIPFENPCLTEADIKKGAVTAVEKSNSDLLHFCFVGRLEAAKGLNLLLETVRGLNDTMRNKIAAIHVVGTGAGLEVYKQFAVKWALPVVFHGFLERNAVHDIYRQCHAIILPSASEGFPKVIAEAMNFGCIPIVSNVSAIGHYIENNKNGFLIRNLDVPGVTASLHQFMTLNAQNYKRIRICARQDIYKFSYAYYNRRIQQEIL